LESGYHPVKKIMVSVQRGLLINLKGPIKIEGKVSKIVKFYHYMSHTSPIEPI
jgi:hypothetical protein